MPVQLARPGEDAQPHPRPLLQREGWESLNGRWEFASDPEASGTFETVAFDREILVPYCPESEKSGIAETGYCRVVWYRQRRTAPDRRSGERLLLHFGAVDYEARVWVNGHLVASHRGGQTGFSAEVSEHVASGGALEIVVRAEDDPKALDQPRGKQDWQPAPHSIWYPRTTGIWQEVWLETVPATYIARVDWTPNVPAWSITLEATVQGVIGESTALRVIVWAGDQLLADDQYAVNERQIVRTLYLRDGGTEDVRRELTWSPEHPQLLQAELRLVEAGRSVDQVRSYTAMRSVETSGDRFLLNGFPYLLRLILDQGYWPESLQTATDEELRRDVVLVKTLGFNGVRKHQKIENPRFLYWCDRLGLLVWEEMPSAYTFNREAVSRLTQEWVEVLQRDRSHPCIAVWVPFNESWGLPDLTQNPSTRAYLRSVYHLTKAMDPTRPVVGNDGWEHLETDILTIHDYAWSGATLQGRYADPAAIGKTIQEEQPSRRFIQLAKSAHPLPVMLTEFGGMAFTGGVPEGWGYSRAFTDADLLTHYEELWQALHSAGGLAGFCYTQLTDTFQEKNGLLFADRSFKADPVRLAQATRGKDGAKEDGADLDELGYAQRWQRKIRPAEVGAGLSPLPRREGAA